MLCLYTDKTATDYSYLLLMDLKAIYKAADLQMRALMGSGPGETEQ